jgi:hypothetical protein
MASSFDGAGLGSFGFEKQFMTGDNPLRKALKGYKTGLILQGMEKSGVRQLFNPSTPSGTGQPVIPPADAPEEIDQAVPPPVQSVAPATAPAAPADLNDELNKEWGLQSSSTFTNSNTFAPSPSAMDTSMLQIASMPAPPPGNINLPQYGKKQGESGNILETIAKLFLG